MSVGLPWTSSVPCFSSPGGYCSGPWSEILNTTLLLTEQLCALFCALEAHLCYMTLSLPHFLGTLSSQAGLFISSSQAVPMPHHQPPTIILASSLPTSPPSYLYLQILFGLLTLSKSRLLTPSPASLPPGCLCCSAHP